MTCSEKDIVAVVHPYVLETGYILDENPIHVSSLLVLTIIWESAKMGKNSYFVVLISDLSNVTVNKRLNGIYFGCLS